MIAKKDDAIKVLHSLCQQIWKTQQWTQDWKRSILVPVPKKGSTKECGNHWTIPLISHTNKVMLKILHARLQYYANQELPEVQAGFIKGRGNRDQIANICWIIEKAGEFQKSIYLFFISYAKTFDCVDHDKLWTALREMETPDHLTFFLRNLYVGQEKTVRSLYGTTDWFKIEKGVRHSCLLSPCLFNLCTEHIMRNSGMDELQAGININILRYVDDATLMVESEEELKSLLMKVKEESERAGLRQNIKKTKIMESSSITSWQIKGENVEVLTDFLFLSSKSTMDGACSHEIRR